MTDLTDQPLGYLLYRVVTVLRPEVAAVLKPLGLALPEFVCLRLLSLTPGLTSADLARYTNVSPQAMNTVLRGLEERAVVTRPAEMAAGRALPAQLTRGGKALLRRAESAVAAADGRVLASLTPAEQREFKRLLAQIGSGGTPRTGGTEPQS